jgi:hypothetical protein
VVIHIHFFEVVFHSHFLGHLPFLFSLGRLPFFLGGRLSSWVKIRLHIKNQLPRLPGSALKSPGGVVGGWVASYPLLSQASTHVEVELGSDKNAFL